MRLVGLFCLALAACSQGAANTRGSELGVDDAGGGAGGDALPGDGDAMSMTDGDGGSPATDFTEAGPYAVSKSSATLALDGCELEYTVHAPSGVADPTLVVLGHGFSRSRDNVVETAAHLASYGVRVASPNYCHSWFLDTNHEQNAVDAVALAAALSPQGPVIYAGHSAGGLSAVLAAAQDGRAIAVLGLDLTDVNDLAARAGASVGVPALGLAGEASGCNASGNGVGAFAHIPNALQIAITGATHCDFESPTSTACTFTCGGDDPARRSLIQTLSVAFVAWQAGLDPAGEAWVTPGGAELEALIDEGRASAL